MAANGQASSSLWLLFVVLSISCWGLYGIFLHSGQVNMADPTSGRYKAFLWVGIAYVIVAIIGPALMLMAQGASWSMPSKGIWLSLLAGTLGAVGAFGVLLAFGAGGQPAVVMSLIFAGAPILNAVVAITSHPPTGGFGSLKWQFLLGIVMAAAGGFMVYLYKPAPGKPAPPAGQEAQDPK
ncbi:MAG: hypothetical protein H6833_07315 [Planctomycetes bacterium]|nr:hypothetical protein [Planctomycetota bacterium]